MFLSCAPFLKIPYFCLLTVILMFSIQNITVQFGGTPLFRNASFIINQKDRIGLAGKNGSGKTTLLRIIMGLQVPDEGDVVINHRVAVGWDEVIGVTELPVLKPSRL